MSTGIYFPNVSIDLKELPSEDLAVHLQEFHSAQKADEPDRKRCVRNMRVALGLDADQWNDSLKSEMMREGRDPKTYNFAQYYVRGLAGNFLMNWFDPKFVDKSGDGKDVSWAANAMQVAWYAQKELYNYKDSAASCLWNGLTYRGIEEIVIDRTKESGGGIRFDSIRPDMILFEQVPSADSIARHSRKAWKKYFLTPEQMIYFFPHLEGQVRDSLQRMSDSDRSAGETHEPHKIDTFEAGVRSNAWGSKYEVVEYYHLEMEKIEKIIHVSGRELPNFSFDVGSEEDYYAKVLWGASNGLDVNSETIKTVQAWVPVLYVTTWCEALGIILENRKDERQLGRLPFFDWSFITKYGKSIGAVDLLIDPQEDINKREAAKTKILSQTPIAGKYWAHPEAYGNDIQKKREFDDNFNDASKILHLDEDAPPGVQLFGVLQGNQIPQSVFQDEASKIDFMNRIASLPLAMQGITERSNESGLHLGRKVIEGSVMQRIPVEALIQHENDKAEAWVKLGLQTWQGPMNYNREFKGVGGKPGITVNVFLGYDDEGLTKLENDISSVDRIDVIISQSKENDYMRQAKREMDAAILNSIRPTPTNGAAIAAFVTDLINAADYNDDEQKEKALAAGELYYQLEMENGMAALMAAKANRKKAEVALQQLTGQGQPPMGSPESGTDPIQPSPAGRGMPGPKPQTPVPQGGEMATHIGPPRRGSEPLPSPPSGGPPPGLAM